MKTMHQLFLIVTIYSWSFFCNVKACGVVVFLGSVSGSRLPHPNLIYFHLLRYNLYTTYW